MILDKALAICLAVMMPAVVLSASTMALAGDLSVSISTSRTLITRGDPLFIKATVSNSSKEAAFSSYEFSFDDGSIVLQVRPVGEKEFADLPTLLGGLDWGLNETSEERIPPGGTIQCLGALVILGRSHSMSAPGRYEIRAVVALESLRETSPSVTVEVLGRDPSQSTAAERAGDLLCSAIITGGVSEQIKEADFLEAVRGLGKGELRSSAEWLGAIAAIRDANTKAGFAKAQADLADLRKSLPPITNDWVSRILAEQYVTLGYLDLAELEVKRLPGNDTRRGGILNRIRSKKIGDRNRNSKKL